MTRFFFLVAAALCFLAGAARAQGSGADKAVAAQLFDDADKLMASGDVANACPKYAESQRLDPQLGTLLHLGECLAQNGKTASAWASFKDALEIATQRSDARAPRIRARIAELEAQLPRLAIGVAMGSPGDLEVKRDGAPVGSAVWGTAVPVDPGEHVVEASAAGRVPFRAVVKVDAGATATVAIPELALAAAPAATAGGAPTAANTAPGANAQPGTPAPPASTASHPGRTQRILGITAIGAGAIGVAVGVVFLLQKSSKLNKADDTCPSGKNCDPGTQMKIHGLTEDARSAQTISIAGFVAGGVLAAVGVALVLSASSAGAERPPAALTFSPVLAHSYQGVSLSGSL